MSSIQPPPSGSLCLDLINTQWRPHGGLQDALETPADTQIWLTTHELWRADLDLAEVRTALIQARTVLRGVLDHPQDETFRTSLNALLARGALIESLGPDGPQQEVRVAAALRPAWLAAHDLLDLLRRAPERIKQCLHPDCILYFFDTSPKNARCWHDMQSCGNRAKAARHYRRVRQGAEP